MILGSRIGALQAHGSRFRSGNTCNSAFPAGAGAVRLQCTGFSERRDTGKRRKKGAVSGAEVPRMVP